MSRRSLCLLVLILIAGGFWFATPGFAQAWPEYPVPPNHEIDRGPGGYFSWIKLSLIIAVFLIWIRMADWVNRDAIKFAQHTGLEAKVWNPLVLLAFVGGFVAVLSIPVFVGGYAVYCLAAFLPMTIYLMQRRGRIPAEAKTGELFAEKIEQTSGPITLNASGDDSDQAQSNLIRARQYDAFEDTATLLHDAVAKRTEQILFDYTRDAVAIRNQIDGIWHQLPPLEREPGDAMLVVMKTLANLNPLERRQIQRGRFDGKTGKKKTVFDFVSQGVPTGERVLIKLMLEDTLSLDLANLGMQPPMLEKMNSVLDQPGLLIVSAPFGEGLSSTWQAILNEADRFTRDFVAVVDHDDQETERENIDVHRFDTRAGETPSVRLKKLILKQPNVFVVPNPVDAATLDLLINQIQTEQRMVVTQTRAGSASEALLRVMSLSGNRQAFVKSVKAVTCQRLLRRLCDRCKQPVQVNPQAIKQMGGNPQEGVTLYKSYQLPPPEQRVGEDGKPIEMEPCPVCAGIGFVGRTAIFELILIDAEIRAALQKEPRLEPITRAVRQQGNLTLLEQAYRAVLDGRTALSEVQRVMQSKK